jgi:hypothetical protein
LYIKFFLSYLVKTLPNNLNSLSIEPGTTLFIIYFLYFIFFLFFLVTNTLERTWIECWSHLI